MPDRQIFYGGHCVGTHATLCMRHIGRVHNVDKMTRPDSSCRKPNDKTRAVMAAALVDMGMINLFSDYVTSIVRRVQREPCKQNA